MNYAEFFCRYGLGFVSGFLSAVLAMVIPYLLYRSFPIHFKKKLRICPYAPPEYYKPPYDQEYMELKDKANHNNCLEKQE
ncbi:MAG: hypothetical protein FD166_2983 [Bacteroidetes bacterium]|nr:MAG: hypothetical protein FD166_2983 [Bacteroidota bacterium]